MVTLPSASRSDLVVAMSDSLCPWLNVLIDEIDNLLHRAPRQENAGDAHFLELRDIDVGNDAADQDTHVLEAALLEQFHQSRADVHVGAAEDRQSDDIG